jgi:hypothetical protein
MVPPRAASFAVGKANVGVPLAGMNPASAADRCDPMRVVVFEPLR